jgi:alpha-L-rhamnosidase
MAYDHIDKGLIGKAYYALDAQIMSALHNALGNYAKEAEYKTVYSKIRKDFRINYIGDDGDLLPEYRKQTGYLLALHTDMFDEGEISAAADALERKIIENGYKLSTGFVGTAILCKTLAKYGKNNIAYSLLLQTEDPSWLYSVHQGATTIWERWNSYTYEKGFGDVLMNSFNHYSFGAIQEWMYRYVAGIEVGEAGFEHLILQPKPDTRADAEIPDGQELITWVKATYNSPKGVISSEWHLENGKFSYKAQAPVNTTLYLPIVTDSGTFTINGDQIKINDSAIEDNCVVLELTPGKYEFEL